MSVRCHLTCVTSDGGIPLFSRSLGNLPSLPFPVLGSLNGVHMFANNHEVELESCSTTNAKVVWKEFHSSIKLTLILFDTSCNEDHLNSLLDSLFHSMVLVVGLEELQVIKKVEKLKKGLRACFPVLDAVLGRHNFLGPLSQTADIIICPEIDILQSYLDAFVEACDSEFGFVLCYGKVVVATERWWQLNPLENMLMLSFIHSLPSCSCQDIPVYLPLASPTIPHRLITIEVTEHVEVGVICGPSPSLQDVADKHMQRIWIPVLDNLRACARCHPRNVPVSIPIDSNILAFMILNTEDGKCLCSFHPSGVMGSTDTWSIEKRVNTLVHFFQSCSGAFLPPHEPLRITANSKPDSGSTCNGEKQGYNGDVLETYWYSTDFKCYAISNERYQIFTVFNNDVPVFALNPLTLETLNILTKNGGV